MSKENLKIPMSQEDAFKLNNFVEMNLTEEKSYSKENYIPNDVLKELIIFCSNFLDLPPNANKKTKWFWYRRGCLERETKIQEFSKKYIEPLLPRQDIKLIGDTAFYINVPPHDVHVDARDFRADEEKKGMIGYKSVVVPLEIDTEDYPYLFTSDQYFYGPSTRMRNGCKTLDEKDPENKRQKECGVYFSYDYKADGVKYISNTELSHNWWEKYIDEKLVPYSTFQGISIEQAHDWKPGNVIVFDSSRIHFAENLKKRGATYKFGISLNYGIEI